jgi:hypothetical protein
LSLSKNTNTGSVYSYQYELNMQPYGGQLNQ